MKTIFKKGLVTSIALMAVLSIAPLTQAETFFGVRSVLKKAFVTSEKVDFLRVHLDSNLQAQLERKLGSKLPTQDYVVYVARRDQQVDGYAIFDQEIGQHEYIDFAVFFDAEGRVSNVEVIAYREPYGEGIRSSRFRKQFVGRDYASGFRPGNDIDIISGATLSTHAMARVVQRTALLLHEAVLKDHLALQTR